MAGTGNKAGARVVIADDDPIIRMDLREMLTDLSYQVVGEAADGRNALGLARDLRPELSATVAQAILQALAKKPDDRYQTAGAFASAL